MASVQGGWGGGGHVNLGRILFGVIVLDFLPNMDNILIGELHRPTSDGLFMVFVHTPKWQV